jgi:capsular polysaccharide biosynthesis protein
MFWLRRTTGITSLTAAKRRIHIRRSGSVTRKRPGGGISESPGFQTLLRDFGFETVEFGRGEHTVSAQVAMLEGAGLILSSNGAALANLAFLNPPLAVIEVLGIRNFNSCIMRMSAALGFRYHGLCSGDFDEQSNIVIDLDELRDLLCTLV